MKLIYLLPIVLIFSSKSVSGQMKTKADLIIDHAVIYCADKNFTRTEAMAIKNGKVLATGTSDQIMSSYTSQNMLDGHGKFIYPGFIDAHCHFYGYSLNLQHFDLSGSKSFDAILTLLKEGKNPDPEGWIVGRGWDNNLWQDKTFPDRSKLDSLFPDRPVVLERIDGHVILANRVALEKTGMMDQHRFNPAEIETKNGRMTGILSENAADHVKNRIPTPDDRTIIRLLKKAEENCFAAGLTCVADAGLDYGTVHLVDSIQRRGELKMRIYAMLVPSPENIRHFISIGRYKTPLLDVRSVKIYADGSLGSRTALLKKPYSDQPANSGILVTPVDSIRKVCSLAYKNGYQVNTHAIGDSAVKIVIGIYREFLKGKNDLRWRIEHSQVVDPEDLPLFGKYSIIPSVQATHATSDMRWAGSRLGYVRVKGAYAYKKLLEQNGWLPDGTDFPVEKIDPLLTFYAAVSRRDVIGFPESGFQTENALTREEALRSITIWAAKGCFEESERGSLEPGKEATFVLLDKDIMTLPISQVPGIKVLSTYIAGNKVFGL
jgi:predicted amidohydrolase YtcJ